MLQKELALTKVVGSEFWKSKEVVLPPEIHFQRILVDSWEADYVIYELLGLNQLSSPEGLEWLTNADQSSPVENSEIVIVVRVALRDGLAKGLLGVGFSISGLVARRGGTLSFNDIEPWFPVARFLSVSPPPVIVVGRANVNMLAQLRAMGPSGVPVYCILTRGEPPAIVRASRYATGVVDVRGQGDQAVVDALNDIARSGHGRPVVFSGGDLDVALLARLWPQIEDLVICPGDPVICEHFNDKQLQIDTVRAAGVRVPESVTVNTVEDLRQISKLAFPVICKPLELARKGAFRGKIFVANTEDELRQTLEPVLRQGSASVLLQEYVPGGIENLLFALVVCGERGKVRLSVTGRKLRDNTKGGMGIGEARVLPGLDEPVRRVFQAFGVSGLLGVEFKRHEETGELYYIESNFRPENIHSINEAAGVNLQLAAYLACIGHADLYQPLPQRPAKWMDFSLVALGWLKNRGFGSSDHSSDDKAVVRDALWAKGDSKPGVVWYLLKAFSLVRKVFSR